MKYPALLLMVASFVPPVFGVAHGAFTDEDAVEFSARSKPKCSDSAGTWNVWSSESFGKSDTAFSRDGTATYRSGIPGNWWREGGQLLVPWSGGSPKTFHLSSDEKQVIGHGGSIGFSRDTVVATARGSRASAKEEAAIVPSRSLAEAKKPALAGKHAANTIKSTETQKPADKRALDQPSAAAVDAAKECASNDAKAQIKGCSYLIEEGKLPVKRLAVALAVRGYAYLITQDRNRAIVDFGASLKVVPNQLQVYLYRGLAYRLIADYPRAIADYTKAIALEPKSGGHYVERGMALAANKENERALADFAKAIGLAPNDAFAYAARGAFYAGQGKDGLALADYNKAVALNPNDADILRERGNLLLSNGQYYAAIFDFNGSIMRNGRDWRPYRDRALANAVAGNYGEALADLGRLAKAYPKFAEVYRIRATIQKKLQRYDLALADFGKLLEIDKNDVQALIGRGQLLAASGKGEQGLADVMKAVELAPDRPEGYLGRAFVRAYLNKPDEALKDVDIAVALDPAGAAVRIDAATVLLALGKYVSAIANLNWVLDSAPENAQALEQRCHVYAVLGEKARALTDCQKALAITPSVEGYLLRSRLQPNSHLAARDLESALMLNPDLAAAKGRLMQMILEASAVLEKDPKSSTALTSRGWARMVVNLRREALEDLKKAVEVDPKNAVAHLGMAILTAENEDAALKSLNTAIRLDPTLADAYFERANWQARRWRQGRALIDLAEAWRLDPTRNRVRSYIARLVVLVATEMRTNPTDVSLVVGRGVGYAALGEFDKAIADLNRAEVMAPGDADILFKRGEVYHRMGDRTHALADLEVAQAADPGNDRIKNLLAEVRKSGGQDLPPASRH